MIQNKLQEEQAQQSLDNDVHDMGSYKMVACIIFGLVLLADVDQTDSFMGIGSEYGWPPEQQTSRKEDEPGGQDHLIVRGLHVQQSWQQQKHQERRTEVAKGGIKKPSEQGIGPLQVPKSNEMVEKG
jgi:hypothetical protein